MTLCRAALCFVACMFVPAQGQPCNCTGGCDSSNLVFPGADGRIVDVAYGKPARMSSTYKGGDGVSGPACMAVNGKIDTVFRTLNESNPNCVHTVLVDIDALWEVDLGRTHTVTNITLYRREGGRENVQRRMSGIHVEVDNQTCYAFPLFDDNPTALDNLPEKIDVTCTPPLTGRVVRLQKRGQGYNYGYGAQLINICEVQVWGCRADLYGQTCTRRCGQCKDSAPCDAVTGHCDVCQPNLLHPLCQECEGSRYGHSCELQCSAQCGGDGSCDRNTGQCQDGCQPGYLLGQSRLCTDKCPEGTFGSGCSQICGQCVNSSVCRHDNGFCEQGCSDGYSGVLCDTKSASSEDRQNLAGPIAGAVFGGLCVIALSIALSILIVGIIRRRSKQRSQSAPAVTMQGSAIQSGGSDNLAVISHEMTSSAEAASDNVKDEENHYYDELQTPDDSDRAPYSSPVFRNGNEIKKNHH
uniref:Fucolectin-related molecule n=1 Tax=Littorina littorea TaxID=31216 RepID=A0A0A7RRL7_LITLI|nr:fucolectin-related molecule [Littorina littorea]